MVETSIQQKKGNMKTNTHDLRRETQPSQGGGGAFVWNRTRNKHYLYVHPLLEEILSREHHHGYYLVRTKRGNYMVSDMLTHYNLSDGDILFRDHV
jgi:hypothetical protein